MESKKNHLQNALFGIFIECPIVIADASSIATDIEAISVSQLPLTVIFLKKCFQPDSQPMCSLERTLLGVYYRYYQVIRVLNPSQS